MPKIETPRLILRPFEERDYDDLYEFLSQRREDQFEAYPDITYENGREHLRYRLGSGDFFAMELKESGKVIDSVVFTATTGKMSRGTATVTSPAPLRSAPSTHSAAAPR